VFDIGKTVVTGRPNCIRKGLCTPLQPSWSWHQTDRQLSWVGSRGEVQRRAAPRVFQRFGHGGNAGVMTKLHSRKGGGLTCSRVDVSWFGQSKPSTCNSNSVGSTGIEGRGLPQFRFPRPRFLIIATGLAMTSNHTLVGEDSKGTAYRRNHPAAIATISSLISHPKAYDTTKAR
jgi:hypothetical protein